MPGLAGGGSVTRAWSAGGPQVACSGDAEVRRLGACVQTQLNRRRNVDSRDRRYYGLSGCFVSAGSERRALPPRLPALVDDIVDICLHPGNGFGLMRRVNLREPSGGTGGDTVVF
ncbi:hypothetical protein NDU88_002323 [Pleurodeles waltl]|uniref:Uncharacterized protein n=1 Tax=Pleurodeles waltl TaxID=8319 RepID=A0AAV7MX17_PLEWA|nr:hypothetical protein NDU88_002323 [Pleurodeles waltl]